MPATARHTFRPVRDIRHAKTPEEFAQTRWNVSTAETTGLRIAVDFDAYRNDRRLDLLHNVGKADRGLELAGLFTQILRNRRGIADREIETRSDDCCNTQTGNGSGKKNEPAGG